MKIDKNLLLRTLRNTSLAAIYIFGVSQIMAYGEKWFGGDNNFTPFVVLLLFSLSAAVVGSLVFGQSVMLFFGGKKKESITAAIYSISWLAVYTIIGLFILAFIK